MRPLMTAMLLGVCLAAQEPEQLPSQQPPQQQEEPEAQQAQLVTVSFYSTRYDGRRTTSGTRFSSKKLTAAHLTLPLGTHVRLTNPANDKSVEVVVNDRGPHVRGRDISVTKRAARELGLLRAGVAQVQMEVLP